MPHLPHCRRVAVLRAVLLLCALTVTPAAAEDFPAELTAPLQRIVAQERARRPQLRLAGVDAGRFATILALGGAAAIWANEEADENPDAMARNLDTAGVDILVDAGNTYGSGLLVGGGALAVHLAGRAAGSVRTRHLGTDLGVSFLTSALVSGTIKHSVDRRRPSGGSLSFPSGHTTTAFSTVPVVAHHLGWWAAAPVAVLAVGTGAGRMEDSHHYLSDVLFGAAVGLAVGDAVVRNRGGGGPLDNLVLVPGLIGVAVEF